MVLPRATMRVPVELMDEDLDSDIEEELESPKSPADIIQGYKTQIGALWQKLEQKDEEISFLKTCLDQEQKRFKDYVSKNSPQNSCTRPTPPTVAADDGFTLVQPKRKKEATAANMLAALCGPSKEANKKARTDAVPKQHSAPSQVNKTSSTQQVLRPPSPATKAAPSSPGPKTAPPGSQATQRNPPPIVIAKEADWIQVSEAFRQSRLSFKSARQCADGIRVYPSGPDDFRQMVTLLRARGAPFHTYQLQEEKTLKVVVRGVPTSVTEEASRKCLQDLGYPVKSVTRMKGRYGQPFPLLFVQLERSDAGNRCRCHLPALQTIPSGGQS